MEANALMNITLEEQRNAIADGAEEIEDSRGVITCEAVLESRRHDRIFKLVASKWANIVE